MNIPDGFILSLFVIILFLIFSVLQIKQGMDEIKNHSRANWLSKLRIIFAIVLLIWFSVMGIVLLVALLNFLNRV